MACNLHSLLTFQKRNPDKNAAKHAFLWRLTSRQQIFIGGLTVINIAIVPALFVNWQIQFSSNSKPA
jgi:hypothetical protein